MKPVDCPRSLSTTIATLASLLLVFCTAGRLSALEHITFRHNDKLQKVSGQVHVRAQDGGVVLETRDGSIWIVPGDMIVAQSSDDVDFAPLTTDELIEQVLSELPPGFQVYDKSAHYLIFYNTSQTYAQWCGMLFERLYLAFTNYWDTKGFPVEKPDQPLVAIIFSNRADYQRWSSDLLGEAASSVVAYYNLRNNRLVLYDMTGAGSVARSRGTSSEINRMMSQPGAAENVATIVHEATHQIAFNSGVNRRMTDTPRWFLEGMAVYFETPDLRSSRGWRGIGQINNLRLNHFKRYLASRPGNSLMTLVTSDDRLLNPTTANYAYAEAWALTYFLLHRYPKQYVEYAKLQSEKPMAVNDTAEQRWEDFVKIFGNDPGRLDMEFVRYIMRL